MSETYTARKHTPRVSVQSRMQIGQSGVDTLNGHVLWVSRGLVPLWP